MMFPGMVMWNVWKERNNQIFWDRKHNEEEVWRILVKNLLKTIRNMQWEEKDKEFSEYEARITDGWGLGRSGLDGPRRRDKFADHQFQIPFLPHYITH